MLIMNQRRDILINLDNASMIDTDYCDAERFDIDATFKDTGFKTLGSYKTEERALEVLKEIAEKQGISTFYMPEE